MVIKAIRQIILTFRANSQLRKGELKKALSTLDLLIAQNQKLQFAYADRGLVLFELREFESSENDLLKSIELNPNKSYAYSFLGDLYMATNRLDEAESILSNGIVSGKRKDLSNFGMGRLMCEKHEFQRAIEYFNRALSLNKNLQEAQISIERCLSNIATQNSGQSIKISS